MLKSKATFALLATIACTVLSAGCSSEKATSYTPEDKAKFTAPLGQPMPAEAKAYMEKMGQGGPPPGAGAPGGAPAGAAPAGAPPAAVPPGPVAPATK